jgi:hypothetical protein
MEGIRAACSSACSRRARRSAARSGCRKTEHSRLGHGVDRPLQKPGARPGQLTDYLDNVREIERRIQQAENRRLDVNLPDAPIGPPEGIRTRRDAVFDLIAVAFQADITRVATFMMARDVSSRPFPQIDVPDPHHALSHESNRGNDPIKIEKFTKVNTYMVQMFASFVQKLQSTNDGAGSLLDHSVLLYGSGMSNGNLHSHAPLPIAVVGGGAGTMKGNRHIVKPDRRRSKISM